MDPNDIDKIVKSISIPRIRTYTELGFSENSEDLILAYFHIQEISSHFFVPLQVLEISLRNAIHNALTARFLKLYPSLKWYNNVHLSDESEQILLNAKRKTERDCGQDYTDDDLISNMSFGFWVHMLGEPHRNLDNPFNFWQQEIGNIFPGRNGKKVKNIFAELNGINKTRNRLYHHEPIWKSQNSRITSFAMAVDMLEKEYRRIFKAIGWIAPEKKTYMGNELNFMQNFRSCCDQYRNHGQPAQQRN